MPADPDKVAGTGAIASEDELLLLAHRLAAGGDPDQVSAGAERAGFVERWRAAAETWVRAKELDGLLAALRAGAAAHAAAFDPATEDAEYLGSAEARIGAGFRVVIYGHTHLPKQVELGGGARYLNTGTWADLMRLPDAALAGDREALAALANDIASDRIEQRRRQVPTFADVVLDGGEVRSAGVFFFDEHGVVAPLDARGLHDRLGA